MQREKGDNNARICSATGHSFFRIHYVENNVAAGSTTCCIDHTLMCSIKCAPKKENEVTEDRHGHRLHRSIILSFITSGTMKPRM